MGIEEREPRRPLRLLFAVVGVGLGNSSRELALFEELESQYGCEIIVAGQGGGLKALEGKYPIHRLPERIAFGDGGGGARYGPLSILRANLGFPRKFWRNARYHQRLLREVRPDAVVADSDFYCVFAVLRAGLPLITINSAPVTVREFARCRPRPKGCGFSYNVIERTDAFIQRWFPNLVIAPTLRPAPALPAKVRQVPPIVRHAYDSPDTDSCEGDDAYDLALTTGGSGIGVSDIDLSGFQGRCVALTNGERFKAPPDTRYVDYTPTPDVYQKRARILVIQGGFSSVSEAVALRRPTVVVPIPRHAEQQANARALEEMGLALVARPDNVVDKAQMIQQNYDAYARQCRQRAVKCDGRRQAATIIVEYVRGQGNPAVR